MLTMLTVFVRMAFVLMAARVCKRLLRIRKSVQTALADHADGFGANDSFILAGLRRN